VCRQEKAMAGGMHDIYSGDESTGKLWRWTIDLSTGQVKEEQLDDAAVDFPRVDDRTIGLPSRFGYAMGLDTTATTHTFNRYLYKYDLETGDRQKHDLGSAAHGSNLSLPHGLANP
jgi:carotenoid cleavage dioxygenase-like enzyme